MNGLEHTIVHPGGRASIDPKEHRARVITFHRHTREGALSET